MVNAIDPIHVFTTAERTKVEEYDECAHGRCACKYELDGEMLQL